MPVEVVRDQRPAAVEQAGGHGEEADLRAERARTAAADEDEPRDESRPPPGQHRREARPDTRTAECH